MTTALTLQEIFDKAYIGVVKQGRPSSDVNGCHYTLNTGNAVLHCAVGHLFPEGTDTDDFNCLMVTEAETRLTEKGEKLASALTNAGVNVDSKSNVLLLSRLQKAHDGAPTDNRFLDAFKASAAIVAANFDLTVPEIPE